MDPFDGLDLNTPAVDAFDGASFGSLAPSPSLRAQSAFGGGNDVLIGGSGADTLAGGAGSDTLALLDDMIRTQRRRLGNAKTGSVRPPRRRLRQPPRPTRRVAPDDVIFANDQLDPNLPFSLSGTPPVADARQPVDIGAFEAALDRLTQVVLRRAARAAGSGGKLGLSPRTVRSFRQLGLFADPDSTFIPPLSLIAEPTLRAAGMLGDAAMRGAGAFVEGTFGGLNQLARELGASRTTANRAERNLKDILTVGGLSAGFNPASVPGAAARARMFRQEVREAERRQMRRLGRQAMRDLGRPRIPQTSTVGEFATTIDDVLTTGRSAVGTVFRGDLGSITIDLGKKGTLVRFRRGGKVVRDIKGGFGLRKIRQKRTVIDGLDGNAFVRESLPKVLAEGRLVRFVDIDNRKGPRGIGDNSLTRRAVIEDNQNRVVLSLFRSGKRETWLLTAFEKKK